MNFANIKGIGEKYSVYCLCPNTQENLYELYYYCCVIRESDVDKAFVKGDLTEKTHYSKVYNEMISYSLLKRLLRHV